MNGRNKFWQNFGNFFKNIGEQLYEFWFLSSDKDGNSKTPFLANFLLAILVLVLGILLIKLITVLVKKALKIGKKTFVKDKNVKQFGVNTLRVILYILLFVLVLSILGIQLSGFSTILSSAILAVGLSLQDVVGNFASGIIILSSKPFVSGDYVVFPGQDVEGTIVDVRFLTTVLETFDNQRVIIPNKNITNNNMINYSTNPMRRLVVNVGINLDGDKEKVKKILSSLPDKDKRILLDPAPKVVLTGLEDNIFTISMRCYVPTDLYWDVLYELNEKLFDLLRKEKIDLGIKKLFILDDNNKLVDFNGLSIDRKGNKNNA